MRVLKFGLALPAFLLPLIVLAASAPAPTPVPAAPATLSDGASAITLDAARTELLAVSPELRERLRLDRTQLANLLTTALSDARLEAAARAAGLADSPDVRARIAKSTQAILIRKYLDEEMAKFAAALPDFTARAREYYEVNLASYRQPEAIQAAHILFKVDVESGHPSEAEAKALADKVLQELRDGADFAAKAKEHSADSGSVASGGKLRGWMQRGSLVPPFEKLAYSMKPGELAGPVRSRFGYHVIRLIDYRPARVQEFDEVKGGIIEKFKNDYLAEKRRELLARFAGKQPIEIDDATWEALRKP